MTTFNTTTETLDFLKKYKLISETASEISEFYYFKQESNTPVICEVTGYDEAFDTWASITIKVGNEVINIHSDYLLDMKKRGRAFLKAKPSSTPAAKRAPASYVVLDLETTGFSSKNDSIIEIAAIKCTYNAPQDSQTALPEQTICEFNELVKTVSTVPPNITKLTGITSQMLEDADSIETVLPKFIDFIGNSKLVGHNIKGFDMHFLNQACLNLGLPEIKNRVVDTLPLAKKALPNLANHKLSTICNFYGIDDSNAHRALADCYMCNECYKRLKQD
ncbi:MAG: 3'-5' exonuclease [Lachnospiraceae bacterium]|nr:3'-5' exonuclease [Lachnospiraceae bacterium]